MDALSTEWIVVLMNAIVIALVITLPLLVGIMIMRIFRRGITQDRTAFEQDVHQKLDEISSSLTEIKKSFER